MHFLYQSNCSMSVNGLALGITDTAEYEELGVDLEAGDLVVFYSDGVIEAMDEAGEMYQAKRLLEVVKQADSTLLAQEMVDSIVKDSLHSLGISSHPMTS